MKLTVPAILLSLAAFASAASVESRVSCSEANRVGTVTITPTTIQPGGTISVHGDYSCAFQKGYPPVFQTYSLAVPVNNTGYEPDVLLAFRNTSSVTATSPLDDFTATVPFGYFNPSSRYVVRVSFWYGHSGTNGSPITQLSEIQLPVTLTGI